MFSTIFPNRMLLLGAMLVGLTAAPDTLPYARTAAGGQDENKDKKQPAPLRTGFLIQIDLPIDGHSAAKVRRNLNQLLTKTGGIVRADLRPVVVLEFDTSTGKTGQGSALGACIDLARYLTSPEMNRLKTVAWIPENRKADFDAEKPDSSGQLNGHAVLVALATDEIAIPAGVQIGSAGIDETSIDPFVSEAYRNVVSKRLTVPVPVAMAMLDRSRQLFRVGTDAGAVYVDQVDLQKLEADGKEIATETLSTDGKWAQFSGQQLVDFGLIRQPTDSRSDLARQLKLPADALKSFQTNDKPYRAVHLELPDYVDASTLQWISRSLDSSLAGGQVNMIIIEVNSSTGDLDACLQMARRLAGYEPDKIRTVAFISGQARGPAALIALSCQHVIMLDTANLGGSFEPELPEHTLDDLKSAAAGIAESIDREPSVLQGMIDPSLEVIRFRDKTTGGQRLLTQDQRDALDEPENWLPQGPLDFFEPLSANLAQQNDIARQVVSGFEELETFYQLEQTPDLLKPTPVDRWLNQVAIFLASPFVAPWLLFGAMFFLFNEVSQPGLGVPGFLGTVCLILYFWSQHLEGNANWLEILLFVAGATFIAIEMFVLPGFGIFGIGGLVMVVLSIVLASQTFIFPTTTQQLQQLPKSLFALVGAFGGLIFALVILRSVLPNTPFFKKIMLEPPSPSATGGDGSYDPEAMVNWAHFNGRKGVAITNLVPAGKAKIDGELINVISDGRMIERDQAIKVIEVIGNRVIVVPLESEMG